MKKTTKKTATKKTMIKRDIAVGAGIAALAAAGYFFFGPKGKSNQKKVKGWMIKMKGEVVEKLESAKEVTEPLFNNMVDTVAETYAKGGKATKKEIADLAKELKSHWKSIAKPVKKIAKKKVAKAVKK